MLQAGILGEALPGLPGGEDRDSYRQAGNSLWLYSTMRHVARRIYFHVDPADIAAVHADLLDYREAV